MIVLLPDPVAPTIARVSEAPVRKLTSRSTGAPTPK